MLPILHLHYTYGKSYFKSETRKSLILWCRKEDYSALRASPLRGRPSGDQIGLRPICRTGLLSVRGSNACQEALGTAKCRRSRMSYREHG
jgi:hypothetical protein